MSLDYYSFERTEDAATLISEKLKSIQSIFTPVYILTGHKETNDWLISTIAEKNGISANMHFIKPSDFLPMMHRHIIEKDQRNERFHKDSICWMIFDELEKINNERVKKYVKDNPSKRFFLAKEIAEMFDRYQHDCQDLISRWNKNKWEDTNPDEKWQYELWQLLKGKAPDHFPDNVKMYEEISKKLKSSDIPERWKTNKPYLICFGRMKFSPLFIQLMKDLSNSIHVDVIASDHGESEKWESKIIKRLGIYSIEEEKLLKQTLGEPQSIKTNQKPEQTVLSALQSQLIANKSSEVKLSDDSISIHSHYTINREVEGLYHFLINEFKNDSCLAQRDVCVICPDIESYSPYIKSFFNQEEFKIACTFYDKGYQIYDSPFKALEGLLLVEKDNFTASQIVGLLNYKNIREKFGITDDLELIKRIISEANIRHTYSVDNIKDETRFVSWEYGFKRLLYGLCLPPHIDNIVSFENDSFIPVDTFEESAINEIAKLYAFVKELHEWLKSRDESRNLEDWVLFIERDTIPQFLVIDEYDNYPLTRINNHLSQAYTCVKTTIDFPVFRYAFIDSLNGLETSEKIGYGGVRFISSNAYISAPAKIYAFLGLNESNFPRKSNKLAFDLNNNPLSDKTSLDKNMFLHVILSARNKLYLSYVGQDSKTNKKRPPSTVIDELWFAIGPLLKEQTTLDKFTIQHTLHGFSSKYLKGIKGLIRHENSISDEVLSWRESKTTKESKEILVRDSDGRILIPLDMLIHFLKDPAAHYYRNILNVYYNNQETEIKDSEPIKLDNLEKWKLINIILQDRLEGKETKLEEILKKDGKLQFNNLGKLQYETQLNEFSSIYNQYLKQYPITETTYYNEFRLDVGGEYRITGNIGPVNKNSEFLYYSPSKNKKKYQIEAAVKFLVLQKLKESEENRLERLVYITHDTQQIIEKIGDNNTLEIFCHWMKKGSHDLIPYLIDLVGKEPKEIEQKDEFEKMLEKIVESWNPKISNKPFSSEYFINATSKESIEIANHIMEEVNDMHKSLKSLLDCFEPKKKK